MNALDHILHYKIVAIIRGINAADVLSIAEALYEGGVRTLEVTLNSPNALQAIEEVAGTMNGKVLVGAGTVLDSDSARSAISAGARFVISPIVDQKTIQVTRELGAVSIPGAFTPTEIVQAVSGGGEIIKVFPASSPDYIKNLKGPLPQIPMMPTGGVTLENIAAFYRAGGVAFGIGSSLVDAKIEITEQHLQELRSKAKNFVSALNFT
jgi:2-dehydro-3-deoxyphosphogluconate aldolase/(4S)-4-hydroxy-2-oxoglutarate aldolase